MPDTLHPTPDLSDRRAQRSRRALWQALFALLQDHDWNAINVQMICQRAEVTRSTFYAHFATKQDLLESGFTTNISEIEQLAQTMDPNAMLPTISWLIDHLGQSQTLRRRLQGSPAGHSIMNRFRAMTADLLERDLARAGHRPCDTDLTFLIGGIFAVAENWLAHGCAAPQATVIASLHRQIAALLPPHLSKNILGG
ncbi:MAG: TetR/AcrR family transcriptional regulator [bacterium]